MGRFPDIPERMSDYCRNLDGPTMLDGVLMLFLKLIPHIEGSPWMRSWKSKNGVPIPSFILKPRTSMIETWEVTESVAKSLIKEIVDLIAISWENSTTKLQQLETSQTLERYWL